MVGVALAGARERVRVALPVRVRDAVPEAVRVEEREEELDFVEVRVGEPLRVGLRLGVPLLEGVCDALTGVAVGGREAALVPLPLEEGGGVTLGLLVAGGVGAGVSDAESEGVFAGEGVAAAV